MTDLISRIPIPSASRVRISWLVPLRRLIYGRSGMARFSTWMAFQNTA